MAVFPLSFQEDQLCRWQNVPLIQCMPTNIDFLWDLTHWFKVYTSEQNTYPSPSLGSASESSPIWGFIRESSSWVSSSSWYYNTAQYKLRHSDYRSSSHCFETNQANWASGNTVSLYLYTVSTSNLSLVPLISMRELRHSPTTIPMCLTRTTLLSRWLCMPPSMHWSRSEKRRSHNVNNEMFSSFYVELVDQATLFLPERSSCSSDSSSRFTQSNKALLTYSCCSKGVCFTALGLAQAWHTDRNTWKHTRRMSESKMVSGGCWPS